MDVAMTCGLATFQSDSPRFVCAIAQDGHTILASGDSGRVHFLWLEE